MKLFLTSAYRSHSCLNRVRELYELDRQGLHQVVNDPEEADAIVFVENTQFQDILFKTLLAHPYIRRYAHKVFMYNEMDRSWPLLPGLYCSLSARMAGHAQYVAFPYLNVTNNGVQNIYASNIEPKWLYSFVGSKSHPIRKRMFSLDAPNARILDTSEFCTWDPAQTSKYSYQKLYIDTMGESKFILCPRGIGPASLRLYETIEAGRVPVVISDEWVEPPQIDWSFAVRIPEQDIAHIPSILANIESEWQDRASAARAAWENTYAPHTIFNTFADSIGNIIHHQPTPSFSFKAMKHKYWLALEQQVRNIIRPPASLQGAAANRASSANQQSLIAKFFSR